MVEQGVVLGSARRSGGIELRAPIQYDGIPTLNVSCSQKALRYEGEAYIGRFPRTKDIDGRAVEPESSRRALRSNC